LIYKYSKERKTKEYELYQMMREKGTVIEKIFINQKDGEEAKGEGNKVIDAINKEKS